MDDEVKKNIEVVVKHVEKIVKASCSLEPEAQKEFFRQISEMFSEDFKKQTLPFIFKRCSTALIPYIMSFLMNQNQG